MARGSSGHGVSHPEMRVKLEGVSPEGLSQILRLSHQARKRCGLRRFSMRSFRDELRLRLPEWPQIRPSEEMQ